MLFLHAQHHIPSPTLLQFPCEQKTRPDAELNKEFPFGSPENRSSPKSIREPFEGHSPWLRLEQTHILTWMNHPEGARRHPEWRSSFWRSIVATIRHSRTLFYRHSILRTFLYPLELLSSWDDALVPRNMQLSDTVILHSSHLNFVL